MQEEEKKSIVCSVTGGIGSGKSTVANLIREMGFKVISSDDNAKEIMTNNPDVRRKLIEEFGEQVMGDNGKINSAYLSSIVFGESSEHDEALMKLNSIVHPFVIEKMIEEVGKLEKEGIPLIFVESALTFEAGLEEGFDYIIVVDSTEEIAIERVIKRSKLTEIEIRHRMAQQLSRQMKRELADFVIENNGSLEELKKSVEFIVNIIREL